MTTISATPQEAASGIARGFRYRVTFASGSTGLVFRDHYGDAVVHYVDGWAGGVTETITEAHDTKFLREFLEGAEIEILPPT